jgi:hypothetical protein
VKVIGLHPANLFRQPYYNSFGLIFAVFHSWPEIQIFYMQGGDQKLIIIPGIKRKFKPLYQLVTCSFFEGYVKNKPGQKKHFP